MRALRPALAAGLLTLAVATGAVAVATGALAGASSTPTQPYVPDPALQTAPRSDLEGRVRRACLITQAKLQNVAESTLERPCGCYATRTIRSFDREEMANYRTRGYFDDTGRDKALAALDACKLRRPV